MKLKELRERILSGALEKHSDLYTSPKTADRFLCSLDTFSKLYGEEREVSVFSVPGRCEISGNHTDHNQGCVIAGAINRDIIAIASKNDGDTVRILSEGYPEITLEISKTETAESFQKNSSEAIVAGVLRGFLNASFQVGGFDAYISSEVQRGSGISSSAAYEVMIANILNHLYCEGRVDAIELAKIGKYAENVYFGKPSGLMDQLACAIGGIVFIDFSEEDTPRIVPIDASLAKLGYSMVILNTGVTHEDLSEEYAAVPNEMKSVARLLGRDGLRGLFEEDIIKNINNIRRLVGDRAVLRSLHFLRENERVLKIKAALLNSDTESFLNVINESGRSSFEYLQNVYSTKEVKRQSISLALALTEGFLAGKRFAMRVHGGGFAGTVQVFLKTEDAREYIEHINSIFGDNSAEVFEIRKKGAVKLF